MRESIQKDMKDVLDEVLVRLKDVECDGVKNNIKNILGRLDV
jgi:hypothetical protein